MVTNTEGINDEKSNDSSCCSNPIVVETKRMSWLYLGMLLASLSFLAIPPITVMFGGSLGKIELDAIALANSLINLTGNTIIMGLATACDTVISQIYGGKNFKLVGIQLQKALVIHACAMCLVLALHINMESFLLLMGQHPMVASLTGRYMMVYIPGLVATFVSDTLRRYVMSQGIVAPFIIIAFLGLLSHILFLFLFVNVLELGLDGTAWGSSVSRVFMLVLTLMYILCSGMYKKTWSGWDWRLFEDWADYTKLAIYSMLMISVDWVAVEIALLITGTVGTVELGAQGVIFNMAMLFFAFNYAMAGATTIRVGQSVGFGDVATALTSSKIGLVLGACVSTIPSILVWTLGEKVTMLFTNDKDVIEMVTAALPVVGFYMIANAIDSICKGILRGVAKQLPATIMAFISNAMFKLPIGVTLLFVTPLGVTGIWIGFLVGSVVNAILYGVYISRLDWKEVTTEAMARAKVKQESPVEKEPHTELTPVLGTSRPSKNGSLPQDSSTEEIHKVPRDIIRNKLVIIGAFLFILFTGILCRVIIPIPPLENPRNVTMTYVTMMNVTGTNVIRANVTETLSWNSLIERAMSNWDILKKLAYTENWRLYE